MSEPHDIVETIVDRILADYRGCWIGGPSHVLMTEQLHHRISRVMHSAVNGELHLEHTDSDGHPELPLNP